MKGIELILATMLLASTIYNVDNGVLRLMIVMCWGVLPVIFIKKRIILKKHEILCFFLIASSIFASYLNNIDTYTVETFGPNAEKLTPILYIFYLSNIIFYRQINSHIISNIFISRFFVILTSTLVLEMFYRLAVAPDLFLNTDMRFFAKSVGLFVNTNIIGQIIAFVLILTIEVNFRHKASIQVVLLFVLVTSMARSAMVALAVTYTLRYILKSKSKYSKFMAIMLIIGSIVFFFIDPFNFKEDGSLISKLDFLYATYEIYFNGSLTDRLFGFGGSYEDIIAVLNVENYSPHLPILKAFLYYGGWGVFVFFFTLYSFYKSNQKMLYPIIIYLVFGMAGAPLFWPTLTMAVIVLSIYEIKRKQS